ncbi:MAG: hypothetical protein AAF503_01050 [Pseudomonadota bacterium]
MSQIVKARGYLKAAPREALADLVGLAGLCAMIFAGFAAPVFF